MNQEQQESAPEVTQPDPDPQTGLEESMSQLGLGSGEAGSETEVVLYPERPGEVDCKYFMQNGLCSFGWNCRYNHPRNRPAVASAVGIRVHPERVGEPDCPFFLRTGTCKFGVNCKFNHPEDKKAKPVLLNSAGYPLRLGMTECSFYMRKGQCRYGANCIFHHPDPAGTPMSQPASTFHPLMQFPHVCSAPPLYHAPAHWQGHPSVPVQYMQPWPYRPMAMFYPPAVHPASDWNCPLGGYVWKN